jgi:hypothetical protein
MKYVSMFCFLGFMGLMAGIIFTSGRYYEHYSLRPIVIQHGCAHYDMASGDFTWGAPPNVVPAEIIVSPQAYTEIPVPKHKPAHGGK